MRWLAFKPAINGAPSPWEAWPLTSRSRAMPRPMNAHWKKCVRINAAKRPMATMAPVWQTVHNRRGVLQDGRKATLPLVQQFIQEELQRIRAERGEQRFANGQFPAAAQLFEQLVASETLDDFLTLKAYQLLP